MAWQLQYTSAASGPSGRAGFQFVAETPGLPPGLRTRIGTYLTYKPPPAAPLTPTPDEILELPVALAYGPAGGSWHVLTRCVYLGTDYSGRYGNYLGHALVVAPDELTGLRPVEFWRAALWPGSPAPAGTALPELAELAPGDFADPESLGGWLRAGGEPSYARLAYLLDVAWRSLARGHGRVIIVAATGDVEEIVRWIAVISYSLPWTLAAGLSFVTYSADPANAPQTLVGTTPDVWIPADIDATVVRLAEPAPAVAAGPGRFAETVIACWRSVDLAGIDAITELDDTDPEAGATLLAFCRGDDDVTPDEQSAIARLLERDPPAWVWPELARAVGRMTFDLASAASAAAPPGLAERCAARRALLALRDPRLRHRGSRDSRPRDSTPSRSRPGASEPDFSGPDSSGPGGPRAHSGKLELRAADRDAIGREVVAALGGARDLRELPGVIWVAGSVGVAVPDAELERTVIALVKAGAGDLAATIGSTPPEWRETLIAGAVAGLEQASPEVRDRMLTDAVSDLLTSRDWPHAPRTAAALVLSQHRQGRLSRVDATMRLLPGEIRDAEERDGALVAMWEEPPSASECALLIERLGARLGETPGLLDLPARTFMALGPLHPEAVRLAELVRAAAGERPEADAEAVRPAELGRASAGGRPEADAHAVLLAARIPEVADPRDAAALLEPLAAMETEVHAELLAAIRTAVAADMAGRHPVFRTMVVRNAPARTGGWLAGEWVRGRGKRGEELALIEVAIRLRMAGHVLPELDEWARARAGARSLFGSSPEAYFRRDGELAAGLRELLRPRPGSSQKIRRKRGER